MLMHSMMNAYEAFKFMLTRSISTMWVKRLMRVISMQIAQPGPA